MDIRRLTTVAAAIIPAAVLTGCAMTSPSTSSSTPRQTPQTPTTTTTGSTKGSTVATHPPLGTTTSTTAPTAFAPVASSFISSETGWVLGSSGCLSCAALQTTTDGGTTWTTLPDPPVVLGPESQTGSHVSGIYFADPNDGFLFGTGLEVTHDGGHSWSSTKLPPVTETSGPGPRVALPLITEVTGGDDHVYAVSGGGNGAGAALWDTTPGSDSWSALPMPETNGAFQLLAEGPTLLLVQRGWNGPQVTASGVGALWTSTDGGSRWTSRPVPGTPDDGGAAVVSIAYGHGDAWLVDCYDNNQSSQEQDTEHHLFGSADGGLHWVRLTDPTHVGEPDQLADNGSGHAFLTTSSGGSDNLVATFDGGLRWSSLFASGGSFNGWADLQFVDSSTGFVVALTQPGQLYRTEDDGYSWSVVSLPSPG